ncbi:protein CLT2, chloroplastic isoform X1 [Ziziphus jujuba]|uniref:Protein CLT2, chloroplastic isoform X1 n=1 Tax=Ziziphus jujuba TaxID=326968 RepID=A0A6P4AJS7_ZIZJJ|nr:protein CLT2, chloroplastic isoform X1 [Ziziphus jujuba]
MSLSTSLPMLQLLDDFPLKRSSKWSNPFLSPTLLMPFPREPRPSNVHLISNPPLVPKPNPRNLRTQTKISPRRRDIRAHISSTNPPTASSTTKHIVFGSVLTVAFATTNRVLYKLALVPMKNYPFFLAQFTTFGYVVIYFSILGMRYHAGIVTDEMLAQPKSRFVVIGVLEALGLATGMSAGAMLPGPAIPLLNQTFLVWQLIFSTFLLGRKYSFSQIAGCLLVATGVTVAVTSGSNSSKMLSGVEFVWPALMIASNAFQAGASIIKEYVFIDAGARLEGKSLDIFVVNSFGSGFQALFVLLFLPLLSSMKGIPFAQLPSYLKSGAGCFLNIGTNSSDCNGAPLLPFLYVIINLIFNISLLHLVKVSSAVVTSLAVMLSVPISIYVLSLPLPYLPDGTTLSPFFLFGNMVLVLGLILYTIPQPTKQS